MWLMVVPTTTDGVSGECFLVERYESDVEEGGEEGEGEQVLLTLSDRFLEEKDINGKVCTCVSSEETVLFNPGIFSVKS